MDDACDWLANHELVSLMLIVLMAAGGIVGVCRWLAQGIIPDEDEHKTNSVG